MSGALDAPTPGRPHADPKRGLGDAAMDLAPSRVIKIPRILVKKQIKLGSLTIYVYYNRRVYK